MPGRVLAVADMLRARDVAPLHPISSGSEIDTRGFFSVEPLAK